MKLDVSFTEIISFFHYFYCCFADQENRLITKSGVGMWEEPSHCCFLHSLNLISSAISSRNTLLISAFDFLDNSRCFTLLTGMGWITSSKTSLDGHPTSYSSTMKKVTTFFFLFLFSFFQFIFRPIFLLKKIGERKCSDLSCLLELGGKGCAYVANIFELKGLITISARWGREAGKP